ncbi:hypothetical protein [Cetobacterium sp.]
MKDLGEKLFQSLEKKEIIEKVRGEKSLTEWILEKAKEKNY